MINLLRGFTITMILVATVQGTVSGCSADSDGFYFGALGLNEGRILVVNSQAAPAQYTVTMYSLTGEFLGVVADTSKDNVIIRGLANYNGLKLMMAQDTPDQLSLLDLFSGEITNFGVNVQLNGNIFDVAAGGNDRFYVTEGNTIEMFEGSQRIPVSGATPYVNTTLATCVLNVPQGLSMTTNGRLVAVSNGNDRVNVYTVTGASTAACFTGYAGFAGTVNPLDAVGHSNGNIYITGNGSDIIYSSPDTNPLVPTQIFLNTGIIDNPTAIAEMPNGNLIVASDVTDSIVEITTTGAVVKTALIKDGFTSNVIDILVIPPQ